MRRLLIVFFIILASFAQPVQAQKSGLVPQAGQTKDAIAEILLSSERLPGHLQRAREVLAHHYVDGDAPLYWVGTGRMNPFLQKLAFAYEDGLKPEDYPIDYLLTLRDTVDVSDPVAAALTELAFSAYFIRYAADLKTGRFVPQKIDPELFQPRRHLDLKATLAGLHSQPDPAEYLTGIEPQSPHYLALKTALNKYRKIADAGGWQSVPGGPVLKPGARDARIPLIRARLEKSGDIAPVTPADEELYDEGLKAAVIAYQRRHGLNDEGIIGRLTLTQMNIPVSERLRKMIVNMERWRWMPEDMGENHIMVNIAAYELQRVRNRNLVERRRVIVGKEYHQTPVFSDELEYIEFNPTWTVPYSIATKEMLPKLKANPAHYGPSFELLSNGRPVPFQSVNFHHYSRKNFPFTLRQKPGTKNALGRVKFILPNKHAVYLHDTPARNLFAQNKRAFSHGCVRVHKPLDFAEKLLADAKLDDWGSPRIQQVLDSRKTTRVNLPEHLPVHLIYATSFLGEDGAVNFRPDIYRRDRKLYNALFAKPTP